ncbi:aminopeptidase P family protein, partial [Mycobacterium tuberculosis]|nr:aminopeptidase P family protein [Mycobacterium tuberculosis]
MTHSQRRDKLKAQIAASGLDAMLISDLINVRYLSGFSGSNGALLVFADERDAVLATDG